MRRPVPVYLHVPRIRETCLCCVVSGPTLAIETKGLQSTTTIVLPASLSVGREAVTSTIKRFAPTYSFLTKKLGERGLELREEALVHELGGAFTIDLRIQKDYDAVSNAKQVFTRPKVLTVRP
mmetsp:Transcript_38337/g.57026  ORF Transcript_38337/g.57026 Transcript_38337/m.57026 type:complete len:123 (+) Transcript_38337:410-778(+)